MNLAVVRGTLHIAGCAQKAPSLTLLKITGLEKKKSGEHSMREPLMRRPEHAVTKGKISWDFCTLRTKEKGKSSLFRVQIGG